MKPFLPRGCISRHRTSAVRDVRFIVRIMCWRKMLKSISCAGSPLIKPLFVPTERSTCRSPVPCHSQFLHLTGQSCEQIVGVKGNLTSHATAWRLHTGRPTSTTTIKQSANTSDSTWKTSSSRPEQREFFEMKAGHWCMPWPCLSV